MIGRFIVLLAVSVELSLAQSSSSCPVFGNLHLPSWFPKDVIVADFDLDGYADLAVSQSSADDGFVSFGDGHGGFGRRVGFVTGERPFGMVAGDFDQDGRPDLAVSNFMSDTVSIIIADAQGGFALPSTRSVGPSPRAVAVADFDGDGLADLVVGHDDDLSVLLGTGAGAFAAETRVSAGDPGVGVIDVATVDFDRDGRADIVGLEDSPGSGARAVVLFGDGQGGFPTSQTFPCGLAPSALAVADADGDGDPDILVSSSDQDMVTILRGDGQGLIAGSMTVAVGLDPMGMTVADFDEDGRPDLAVAAAASDEIALLFGDGHGGFGNGRRITTDARPTEVVAADFDSDGYLDVAATCWSETAVRLADGPGSFANTPTTEGDVYNITLAEVTQDGHLDLIVADFNVDRVAVLAGDGAGRFTRVGSTIVGSRPSSPVAANFDGDALVDVAVLSRVNETVSILRGLGQGAFTQTAVLPCGPFPVAIESADIDSDGNVDLAVANFNTITLFFGDGQGAFSTDTVLLPHQNDSALGVVAGDLDNDGNVDLIAAVGDAIDSTAIMVFRGDGQGAFGLPTTAARIPDTASRFELKTADFDRDGNLDVAAAGFYSNLPIYVFFGDGSTMFSTLTSVRSEPREAFAVADFDRNGFADLVSVSKRAGHVSMHLADGQRGFAPPTYFGYGIDRALALSGLALGDIDGDGVTDLAVANAETRTTTTLLNRCGSEGSGDDFSLRTEVNEGRVYSRRRRIVGDGDLVRVDFRSPLGSLNGAPAFLAGQLITTGSLPRAITGFPEVHLDPAAMPSPFIIHGPITLPFTGLAPSAIVPPGLEGNSMLLQAFAIGGSARNGIFAATNAHELRFGTLPPPVITSVSPLDPSPGERVTLLGRDFSLAATLTVGGTRVPVRSASHSALGFDYPASPCSAAVVVTNPDGQSASVATTCAVPVIEDVSPLNGFPGDVITVMGREFTSGLTLTVGGNVVAPLSISEAVVRFAFRAGLPCPTTLTITNANGNQASAPFNPCLTPVITDVTPVTAPPGAPITINGSSFMAGLTVSVNGTAVIPTSTTATTIVFPFPTGAACDTTIVVTNPGGMSASAPFNPSPTISASTPDGPAAGSGSIVVIGTGFVPGTAVTIDGAPAAVQFILMETFILATAPPGAPGPATLAVTLPSGCSATTTYVYL